MVIPVRCGHTGCGAIVGVPESLYDVNEIFKLRCPKGHLFTHAKRICPQCGDAARPAERRPQNAWVGETAPEPHNELHHARCINPDCDWEGPKSA